MTQATPPEPADRDPLLIRVFHAPREMVFGAWTDPDRLARWAGPEGFDTPRDLVTVEPHVGGRYDYCMVEVDRGERFWMRNTISELVSPELLVLVSDPLPEFGAPHPVTTRVQFEDIAGITRVTLTRPYPTERRATAAAGWSSSFDKLEGVLNGTG